MTGFSRRTALLAAGTLPLLAACGGSDSERSAGNPAYARIDQKTAIDHGPVAKHLPETPTLRRIRGRRVLRQSGSLTAAGFALRNPRTGAVTGFDAGLAQLLAKYLIGEPNVDTITGGADTREGVLQNHSVDVSISTYTIKPSRAELVLFAGPYYIAHSGVVLAAHNKTIHTLGDLNGKRVAVQPGAADEAVKKGAPAARTVVFDEATQCAAAVRQGRVEAWSANTALLLGKAAVDKRIRMTDIRFGFSPFGIGLPKDDPAFKAIVVDFLTRIMADGTWRMLWQSTVGVLEPGSAPRPPRVGSVPGS